MMALRPGHDAGNSRPLLGGRAAWTVLVVGQFAAVIAVLQRSSLGVAATEAYARFGIAAVTLATFTVLQLIVYAAMQVSVGVLIDRYGSKRLIVAGSAPSTSWGSSPRRRSGHRSQWRTAMPHQCACPPPGTVRLPY
jgi:hypothetical protein